MKPRIIRPVPSHLTLAVALGMILAGDALAAAPTLSSVRGSGFPHGIVVTFSEAVEPASASDKANYQLSGQNITIESVSLLATNQVLLKVSRYETTPLTLTVSNVKDASAANPMAANSRMAVAFRSNLLGYWSFNEGRGTVTADAVNRYDGALINGPVWSADTPNLGRPNPFALQFDGTTNYVQTTCPGVGGDRPRTVSFWLKTDVSPPNTHGIVAWGNSTASSLKYHVRLETTTGSIRSEAQGGNNWATTPLNDGVWHHVVSMLPAGVPAMNFNVQHYVDGVLETRLGGTDIAINTDITSASAIRVRIGGRDQVGAAQSFPGSVDEVAIFEGDLTVQQIAQLAKGADPFQFAKPLAAAVALNQQPSDASVAELGKATFSVTASGSPLIGYQWFKNGQPIAGATASSYTTPAATSGDHQAKFHVEVFNLDGTFNRLTSQTVTLTVVTDRQPPGIVALRGVGSGLNRIIVQFSEPLDRASATTAGNYQVEGVNVTSASLDAAGTTVTLQTAALTDGNTYKVTVTGVKDLAVVPNVATGTVQFKAAPIYTDQILIDQPDIYFPLGDRAGPSALNLSGKDAAYVGTLTSVGTTNLPTLGLERLVPGTLDTAIGFAAASSQVLAFNTDSTLVNSTGPFLDKTIELWFKANRLPRFPSGATLPDKMVLWEQGGVTRGISIYLCGTQDAPTPTEADLYFHAWNDSADGTGAPWGGPEEEGKSPVFVKTKVQPSKLYHAVMVLDGDNTDALAGRLDAYLNGQKLDAPAGQNLAVGTLYAHGDNAGLGGVNQNTVYHDQNRNVTNGDYFDGIIDEFSIYNKILSASRIQAHYTQGLTPATVTVPEQEIRIAGIKVVGGNITIEWTGGGILQSAENVTGPFTHLIGSTSPFSEPVLPGKTRFYRVQRAP